MSNKIEWVPLVTVGSPYEEQVSSCGRYWRHRKLMHEKMSELTGQVGGNVPTIDLPWRPGRAPYPSQEPKP